MKAKKIGIMGGTFNPIHIGHLILAETARTQFELDEILFIPSGHSYMKKDILIPPGEIRAEMTSLAIADNPFFALSLLEIERAGNTYTYETLKELKEANPNTEYFFILGADSLFALKSWKCPQQIFDACTILVAVRESSEFSAFDELQAEILRLQAKYHGKIELLQCGNMEISSTQIRKRIQKGESVRYLLPDKVIQYIQEKNLYRE